jgi:hypothetical protein
MLTALQYVGLVMGWMPLPSSLLSHGPCAVLSWYSPCSRSLPVSAASPVAFALCLPLSFEELHVTAECALGRGFLRSRRLALSPRGVSAESAGDGAGPAEPSQPGTPSSTTSPSSTFIIVRLVLPSSSCCANDPICCAGPHHAPPTHALARALLSPHSLTRTDTLPALLDTRAPGSNLRRIVGSSVNRAQRSSD